MCIDSVYNSLQIIICVIKKLGKLYAKALKFAIFLIA